MERRTLVVALLFVSAGCLGGGAATNPSTAGDAGAVPPATLAVENTTVERGGSAVVVVDAHNVGELRLRASSRSSVILEYANATFSPAPTVSVQTYPPYWVWKSVEPAVTVRVPLRATENATVGAYRFEAVAWNSTDHSHESGTTETFVVRVTDATGN